MTAEIPAGWYPNPWNDAEELYWSGTEWTGISRVVHHESPAAFDASVSAPSSASDIEDATIMRPASASPLPSASDPAYGGTAAASDGAQVIGAPPVSSSSRAPYGAPQPAVAEQAAPDATRSISYDPPQPFYAAPAAPYAAPGYGAPYATPQAAPSATPEAPQSTPAPPVGYTMPFGQGGAPAQTQGQTQGQGQSPAPDAASIRWALGNSAPGQPVGNPRAKFGLIAMIIGIVAVVFAIIPGLSLAAWLPAFVAIGLGIVGYLGGRPRTFALVGIVTGGVALAVGTGVSIWFLTRL